MIKQRYAWLLLIFTLPALAADDWTRLDQQAATQYRAGQYEQALDSAQQALDSAQQALALAERQDGAASARVASSLNSIALIRDAQGQPAQAQPLLERALAISEKVLPADHPNLDALQFNLGSLYEAQQNYDAAAAAYGGSLLRRERRAGAQSPELQPNLRALVRVALLQQRNAEAEALATRLLALQEAQTATDPEVLAQTLTDLATARLRQHPQADVQALLQRALQLREQHLGSSHASVADSLELLARYHDARGRADLAEPLHQRLLTLRSASGNDADPRRAQTLNDLALAHHGRGEFARAAELYEQALAILDASHGADSLEVAQVLGNLAATHEERKQYKEAQALLERSVAIYERHPAQQTALAGALMALGNAQYMQRRFRQAEPLYLRALELLEQQRGDAHPDLLPVLDNLAALYQSTGREPAAQQYRQRATGIRRQAG